MKRCIAACIFAIAGFSLFGQHTLSAHLNGGMGTSHLITDFEEEQLMQSNLEDTYSATFSVEGLYAYQIGNWGIETGAGFSFIEGSTKETFNIYYFFDPSEYDVMAVHEQRKASYVTVPLRVGYSFHDFTFAAGMYGAVKITDASNMQFYRNGTPNGFQQGGNRLSATDLGLSARVHYTFYQRFGAQFSLNYGLAEISNGNQLGAKYTLYQLDAAQKRELKNRQFMLGISYTLF